MEILLVVFSVLFLIVGIFFVIKEEKEIYEIFIEDQYIFHKKKFLKKRLENSLNT